MPSVSAGGTTVTRRKENGSRTYFRVWKEIDVSAEEGRQKFLTMLSDVFKNVVMKVSLDRRPEAATQVAAFVEHLRQRPSLFFTADPEAEPHVTDAQEQQASQEETQLQP